MGNRVDMRNKSARDIEQMLRDWAFDGRIKSKTLMGKEYNTIKKKYASEELFVTSIEGIDVTNKDDLQTFEALRESKRILTKREVMLYKHLTSDYQVQQSVNKGELVRFDILGKSSIIYIE